MKTPPNNPSQNINPSEQNPIPSESNQAAKTHLIKKQHYHGQAKSKPDNLLLRVLRGFKLKKDSPLPKKRTIQPPPLEEVPESILDEIKMHYVQTEQQLRKARLRQALFLNKRRKTKHSRRLITQFKVMGRLLISFTLLGVWIWLLQAPVWTIPPSEINIYTPTTSPKTFTNTQALQQLVQQKIGATPIYQLNPQPISLAIQNQFKTVAHVSIRRSLFPNSIDIALIEKPTWASLILLHPSNTSTLSNLETRWQSSITHWNKETKQDNNLPEAFEQVGLLHPEGQLSVFNSHQLTFKQKEALLSKPPIFVQGKLLNIQQRASLQKIVEIWKEQDALFMRSNSPLMMIDARDPKHVFAVFRQFKAHLGPLDSQIVKRSARLPHLLNMITQYQEVLDWVELGWNQQVTLKLKSSNRVAYQPI